MPLERSVPLTTAEAAIDRCLASLDLACSVVRHGTVLSSTVVTLQGASPGRGDSVGCGKGHLDEARVGAKFEAYEHLLGPTLLRRATGLACRAEVLAQPALAGLLPLRLLEEGSDGAGRIGVIRFDGDAEVPPLDHPAFLLDYTYATDPLPLDGTGVAVGLEEPGELCRELDAALHACRRGAATI